MGVGLAKNNKPTPDRMLVLHLAVSDVNKQLLLGNAKFVSYLISGLFLDIDHPRANLTDEIKAWNQQMHAECFAQIAMYDPGRSVLLENPAVSEALEAVTERGMSEQARTFAQTALVAMKGEELRMRMEGDTHVMLSYQWNSQKIVERLNNELKIRGYLTWFDLINMKGST